MDVDLTQLDRLIVDMGRVPAESLPVFKSVVTKGVINMKRDAKAAVSGLAHAPHYPRAITDDVYHRLGAIVGEVGPDKALPQGALGNLLEYGSENNAPIPHLGPALADEAPRFERALADVAGRVLDQ